MEPVSKKIKSKKISDDTIFIKIVNNYTNSFFKNIEKEITTKYNKLMEEYEKTRNKINKLKAGLTEDVVSMDWTSIQGQDREKEELERLKIKKDDQEYRLSKLRECNLQRNFFRNIENFVKGLNKILLLQMLREEELIFVDSLNISNWKDYYGILSDPTTSRSIQEIGNRELSRAYDRTLIHIQNLKNPDYIPRERLNIVKDICFVIKALIINTRARNKNFNQPKFVLVYRTDGENSFYYDNQKNYVIKISREMGSETDDLLCVFLLYLSMNVPTPLLKYKSSILTQDNYKWADCFNLEEQKNKRTLVVLDDFKNYNLKHDSQSSAIMRK